MSISINAATDLRIQLESSSDSPTGIQVKRYRNNVQRPDIEKFIGALSGRFSQGMFMTTANYAPGALQKASTSIPRILTLNGDQIVSVMIEHHLGLKTSSVRSQKLDIDPDYFATFEAMRGMLLGRVNEARQSYRIDPSQFVEILQARNGESFFQIG